MKYFILLILFSFSAMASNCMVDGISDSPQKYNCFMNSDSSVAKLNLVCRDGLYEINWAGKAYNVNVAYHEEVEEGSSPLVFVTDRMTLTTVSFQTYSRATVTIDGKSIEGRCFN